MNFVDDVYRRRALQYDLERSRHWGRGDPLRHELADSALRLFGNLSPRDFGVDVGAGTGRMLELQRHLACHWINLDRSLDMLRVLESKLPPRGSWSVCGDAHALPLQSSVFSAAMLISVVQYLNLEQTTSELRRILGPGSRVLVGAVCLHKSDLSGWRNFATQRGYPGRFRTLDQIVAAFSSYGFSLLSSSEVVFRRTFEELHSDKRRFSSLEDLKWAVDQFVLAPSEMQAAYEIDDTGFTQFYHVLSFDLSM